MNSFMFIVWYWAWTHQFSRPCLNRSSKRLLPTIFQCLRRKPVKYWTCWSVFTSSTTKNQWKLLVRLFSCNIDGRIILFCAGILAMDRAGLDTNFYQFEKRLPRPKIKCTRRIHLEIHFNLVQSFIRSSIFYWKPLLIKVLHFLEHDLSYLVKHSIERNMKRGGGKRLGAGREKSPSVTKITGEITWRPDSEGVR